MEFDLKIANSVGSTLPRGQVNIYILRDNPMKMAQDYATGLDDQFDGIRVTVTEGIMKTRGKDAQARSNWITAQVRDMDYQPLAPDDLTSKIRVNMGCRVTSEHMVVTVHHKKTSTGEERLIVASVDEDHKESICYEQTMPEDFFSQDHETFIFVAAHSGSNRLANRHEVNRISFKDIEHLHDDEELLDDAMTRSWVGKGADLMAIK